MGRWYIEIQKTVSESFQKLVEKTPTKERAAEYSQRLTRVAITQETILHLRRFTLDVIKAIGKVYDREGTEYSPHIGECEFRLI